MIGVVIGAGAVIFLHRNDATSAAGSRAAAAADNGAPDDLAALKADVARLKANAPSQSHSMSDVGYHMTNLWFAAEKKNWPLAQFYFGEARDHPLDDPPAAGGKGPNGQDVNLMPIFEGIDTSASRTSPLPFRRRIQRSSWPHIARRCRPATAVTSRRGCRT